MKASLRVAAVTVLAAPLMAGCVTKGAFRREMASVRSEMATERGQRVAGDSALRTDVDAVRAEVTSLRGELGALRTEFGAKITAMEEGVQFAFPVNFAYDESGIRAEDRAALDRFARVAQKFYAGSAITVEGFADPAGSQRYNLALSRRRAESVRAYLASQGITAPQLKAVGYGEQRLVAPGASGDEPGAQANRRVVFVVETRGDVSAMTASALQ